jgi:hypothetical protein
MAMLVHKFEADSQAAAVEAAVAFAEAHKTEGVKIDSQLWEPSRRGCASTGCLGILFWPLLFLKPTGGTLTVTFSDHRQEAQ